MITLLEVYNLGSGQPRASSTINYLPRAIHHLSFEEIVYGEYVWKIKNDTCLEATTVRYMAVAMGQVEQVVR